jgi:hypothetical protein
MSEAHETREHHRSPGHETTGMSVRGVVASAAGLVGLILAVMGLMGLLSSFLTRGEPPAAVANGGPPRSLPLASEPPLPAQPKHDLREVRAAEDRVLNSYGWVDREAGIARIPISRAMEILADEGLPTQPPEELR